MFELPGGWSEEEIRELNAQLRLKLFFPAEKRTIYRPRFAAIERLDRTAPGKLKQYAAAKVPGQGSQRDRKSCVAHRKGPVLRDCARGRSKTPMLSRISRFSMATFRSSTESDGESSESILTTNRGGKAGCHGMLDK
jgi:hypothetical protein